MQLAAGFMFEAKCAREMSGILKIQRLRKTKTMRLLNIEVFILNYVKIHV